MARLPKFDLHHNKNLDTWDLTDVAGDLRRRFENKADATAGGVLPSGVGTGSVKIRTKDNKIQEERTYPRSADPKKSPG